MIIPRGMRPIKAGAVQEEHGRGLLRTGHRCESIISDEVHRRSHKARLLPLMSTTSSPYIYQGRSAGGRRSSGLESSRVGTVTRCELGRNVLLSRPCTYSKSKQVVATILYCCTMSRCDQGSPHLLKPWFVDRQRVAVPGINTSLIDINHNNLDVWAFVRNHCHSGPPHIPGADTADGRDFRHGYDGLLKAVQQTK